MKKLLGTANAAARALHGLEDDGSHTLSLDRLDRTIEVVVLGHDPVRLVDIVGSDFAVLETKDCSMVATTKCNNFAFSSK